MGKFGRISKGRKSRTTGRGGTHGRTANFFTAASRRLAWNDYEAVSVAMICRDARSTPHTFYRRFPNKRAFLYALVLVTFRERAMAFERTMFAPDRDSQTPQVIAQEIVAEIIAGTMTVAAIGVAQLAIRIGMSKPKGAEPFLEYRKTVTECAVKLLTPQLDVPESEGRVRAVIDMLFATAMDEAWRHGIPFSNARLKECANSFFHRTACYLGLSIGDTNQENLIAAMIIEPQYSEDLISIYSLSKRELHAYEKEINSSRKPTFWMDEPIDPTDLAIVATRDEQRKSQKPFRRIKPTQKRHDKKRRYIVI